MADELVSEWPCSVETSPRSRLRRPEGLFEYQMAALVWLNGLIIGVLVGAWLF